MIDSLVTNFVTVAIMVFVVLLAGAFIRRGK